MEILNELASLRSQVKALRMKDRLRKQNFREEMEKVFELLTKSIKDVSEYVRKTIIETSEDNKKALTILNNKFTEILNDRCILSSYLLSSLSKINNPEHTSLIKLMKNHESNTLKDPLINISIPVTLCNI